jgi:hypothetical protein
VQYQPCNESRINDSALSNTRKLSGNSDSRVLYRLQTVFALFRHSGWPVHPRTRALSLLRRDHRPMNSNVYMLEKFIEP